MIGNAHVLEQRVVGVDGPGSDQSALQFRLHFRWKIKAFVIQSGTTKIMKEIGWGRLLVDFHVPLCALLGSEHRERFKSGINPGGMSTVSTVANFGHALVGCKDAGKRFASMHPHNLRPHTAADG